MAITKKATAIALGTFISVGLTTQAQAGYMAADVAFVIDQSGSMQNEFAWLGNSLATMDNQMRANGIDARYAVAGYERLAGSESNKNIFVDFTKDFNTISSSVNFVNTYGSQERGYHAAHWALGGFNWQDNRVKMVILITDESGDQASTMSESQLAGVLKDNNVLLNVISMNNYASEWDEMVYTTKDGEKGFFDLDKLRADPELVTNEIIERKVKEIIEAPEPATAGVIGFGLLSLLLTRRRRFGQVK
ncbi:vWA domain-containing protein [Zooshikella harenae]|uniref:VWA domain-containing protein n=1 Tax=Zooshikella harenae TaxID=2827238 RepID=A0ABS5ZH71_9GAMM|nr:vWA domain-containing protein [Zooshikella harenae]MBU2713315.1 VWA domain-containing protein [Zooshikella harenae]